MSHTTKAKEEKTVKGLGSKIDYRVQTKIPAKHFIAGDISNKIPVYLSDGKTIVFAKSEKDVERVKKFWEEKIKQIVY